MPEELNLSNLKPAQAQKSRKRIGRGPGSGKGRYSGRGIKGQKSRSGSHKMHPGFEGGQMPLDMRLPKLRGNTSADAMPIGPFRTYSQPVNVKQLEERFEAGEQVTPEALKAKGLIRSIRKDVKILGVGELTKKLEVSAHTFSASARDKIEAAGGTATALKTPKKPRKGTPRRSALEIARENAAGGASAAPAEKPAKGEKSAKGEKAPKAEQPAKAEQVEAVADEPEVEETTED